MKTLTRSENMARIRSRDTAPELKLRKALWGDGLRYRLKSDLPGRPDLIFAEARLAIFMDGCFWHGCPLHYSAPANRSDFWAEKLRENVRRDLCVDEDLAALDWRSFRVWQHDLTELDKLVRRVADLVSAARHSEVGKTESDGANGEACTMRGSLPGMKPWFLCECGSANVRVVAVSGPGSLRARAVRRPEAAELVCMRCRGMCQRRLHGISPF